MFGESGSRQGLRPGHAKSMTRMEEKSAWVLGGLSQELRRVPYGGRDTRFGAYGAGLCWKEGIPRPRPTGTVEAVRVLACVCRHMVERQVIWTERPRLV